MGLTPLDPIVQLDLARADEAFLELSVSQVAALIERANTPPAPRPPELRRWEDVIIEREIHQGASVLDLGCGRGELLRRLIAGRDARVQGVEIDPDGVMACVSHGVPVLQADLDQGLAGLPDRSYDYVVLEETLQTVRRPLRLLEEMLRVGSRGIVSFPNFGYWRVRLDLTVRGRMPVTEWLPYQWHDSPNIHLFTLRDLLDWTQRTGVHIVSAHVLADGEVRPMQRLDNLYAEEALLVVERTK